MASNGVDGSNRGCIWWYVICGLVLAIIIFLTMRWSSEYAKEMYEEKKPVTKKQIEKKEGHGQW